MSESILRKIIREGIEQVLPELNIPDAGSFARQFHNNPNKDLPQNYLEKREFKDSIRLISKVKEDWNSLTNQTRGRGYELNVFLPFKAFYGNVHLTLSPDYINNKFAIWNNGEFGTSPTGTKDANGFYPIKEFNVQFKLRFNYLYWEKIYPETQNQGQNTYFENDNNNSRNSVERVEKDLVIIINYKAIRDEQNFRRYVLHNPQVYLDDNYIVADRKEATKLANFLNSRIDLKISKGRHALDKKIEDKLVLDHNVSMIKPGDLMR